MMTARGAALAAVAALLATLAWWAGSGTRPPPAAPGASSLARPPVSLATREADARTPAPLVAAWVGGDPDGLLTLSADGRLLTDLALRRRFDWLLSADAGIGRDAMRARLQQDAAAAGFSPAVTGELLALFDRYLDYLAATDSLDPGDRSPEQLRAVLERRRALRRAVLGVEAADGFFAADEARDAWFLDNMAIVGDRSLDAATRAARLSALRATAPLELRQVEEDRAALAALTAADQASPAQRQALREQAVGPAAAARLAALDEEDAAWAQRLAEAAVEQRSIAAADLSADDRQRALTAMIERRYTGPEQVRARAQLGIDAP